MAKVTQQWECAGRSVLGRVAILAVTLSALVGCAIGKKAQSLPAEQKAAVVEPSPVPQGPSVARLPDGLEGFVITETPHLEAGSRQDFERAIAMMQDQDYDQAVGLLEKVVAQSPGVTAPYIDLAMAYEQVGKLEPAEQNLKTALSLVPHHPVASNEYGMLLRKMGRFAEAREVYEKAITTFPEFLPVHRNLGILCELYLNDPACALEQYEFYSKAVPKDEQVKIWIAGLRLSMKQK